MKNNSDDSWVVLLLLMFVVLLFFFPIIFNYTEVEATFALQWISATGSGLGAVGTVSITYFLYKIEKSRHTSERSANRNKYYQTVSNSMHLMANVSIRLRSYVASTEYSLDILDLLNKLLSEIEIASYGSEPEFWDKNITYLHELISKFKWFDYMRYTLADEHERLSFNDKRVEVANIIISVVSEVRRDIALRSKEAGLLGPYEF